MIFLSPFPDVPRMPMSTVSFLAQLVQALRPWNLTTQYYWWDRKSCWWKYSNSWKWSSRTYQIKSSRSEQVKRGNRELSSRIILAKWRDWQTSPPKRSFRKEKESRVVQVYECVREKHQMYSWYWYWNFQMGFRQNETTCKAQSSPINFWKSFNSFIDESKIGNT